MRRLLLLLCTAVATAWALPGTPSHRRPLAPRAAAAPRVKRVARARQSPKLRAVAAGGGPAWAGGVPGSVVAVIAAAFLNLLGFTMTGPITPDLAKHFGLPVGGSARVGMLTSAYPFGMLAGLAVWPRLSDKRGMRKPILVLSLGGVGLGLAAQSAALARNAPLWTFLSLRALSGACGGASPVAKAYLADAATGDQLPRWLAWREAAATFAFIVGPLFGGLLIHGTSSLASVVGVTAAFSLLAAGIVGVFVEEVGADKSVSERKTPKLLSTDSTACPLGSSLVGAIATICAMSALENAGAACWDAFGAVLARNRFGLDARGVGVMLTSLACVSFGVSTTLFDRVRRRIGLVRTAVLGLCLVATGLGSVGLARNSLTSFGLAAALYQLGKPLYAPTVPTLLLQCVPPDKRGLAMGIDAAVNTVARCVAPLALGALLRAKGEAAAFGGASGLVLGAVGLALLRARNVQGAK